MVTCQDHVIGRSYDHDIKNIYYEFEASWLLLGWPMAISNNKALPTTYTVQGNKKRERKVERRYQ